MNQDTLINMFISITSLMGIWWMSFWLYRDYCIDAFRQDIFELRDRLYDDAAGGIISFDHPAYGLLRMGMNGFLRFAHRLSISQVLIFFFLLRNYNQETNGFHDQFDRAVDDLPANTREKLCAYLHEMNFLILRHLLLSSPILLVTVIFPIASWLATRFCLKQLMSWSRIPIDQIETAAVAEGF